MITALFLHAVGDVVSWVMGLFPSLTLPSWASSTPLSSGVADTIGGLLGGLKGFLPVDLLLSVLATVFAVLPVVGAFVVFQWIWNHLPTIAGFGV